MISTEICNLEQIKTKWIININRNEAEQDLVNYLNDLDFSNFVLIVLFLMLKFCQCNRFNLF